MTELPSVPKKYFEHKLADTVQAKKTLRAMAGAVRNARVEQRLTIKKLAALAGVSYQQISHIEHCDNFPSFSVYLALCKALKQGRPPLT